MAKQLAAASTGKTGMLGDLVFWDFYNVRVSRLALRDVFAQHGFVTKPTGAPYVMSDERSVGDAIMRARGTDGQRGVKVVPFKQPEKDTPASLGFYWHEGKAHEVGDEFPCGARVRAENGKAVACEPANGPDPRLNEEQVQKCRAAAEFVAKRANELMNAVDSNELSTAMCAAGSASGWVTYRRNLGGLWFIYEDGSNRRANFRSLVNAVEKLCGGSFVPTVNALIVDEDGINMSTAHRAMGWALEDELQDLVKKLEAARKPTTRTSTIEERIGECQALIIRANIFRSMLEDKADTVADKVRKLKDEFGALLDPTSSNAFNQIDSLLAKQSAAPAPAPAPAPKRTKTKPAPAKKPIPDDPFDLSGI